MVVCPRRPQASVVPFKLPVPHSVAYSLPCPRRVPRSERRRRADVDAKKCDENCDGSSDFAAKTDTIDRFQLNRISKLSVINARCVHPAYRPVRRSSTKTPLFRPEQSLPTRHSWYIRKSADEKIGSQCRFCGDSYVVLLEGAWSWLWPTAPLNYHLHITSEMRQTALFRLPNPLGGPRCPSTSC
jgi:hypothetical protein